MFKALTCSFGLSVVAALSATTAQAETSLWDEFDEVAEADQAIADAPVKDSPFSGSVLAFGSFATSSQRDGRFARQSGGLEETGVELTFGYERRFGDRLRLKSEFVIETFDAKSQPGADRTEFRLGESYLHFDASASTWARLGNLIVPFGTSDAFEVLNVLNPQRDELWGIDHPNGARLPVPAAQLVAVSGDYKFQLAVAGDFQGNQIAGAFQDHDPLIRDRAGTTIRERSAPDSYTPEWVASVSYFGEGLDLSFMLGEVYSKQPVLAGVGVGAGGLQLETDFPRYSFAGVSGAGSFGSWLVRGDLGYFKDQSFFNQGFYANPAASPGSLTSDVVRAVVGLEYSGLSGTILSLELNRNVILDWQPGMRTDKISDSVAANAQFSLLDDRLGLEFTVASLANNDATFLRAKADYALSDRVSLTAQWADFRSNDAAGFMEPHQDADRVYLGLKSSF